MSPILITVLVVGGILIVLLIVYLNHSIEANKLEKARRKAELSDRLRRSELICEGLPAQLMSPALKLLLTRVQLHCAEQLIGLDKKNTKLRSQAEALKAQLAKGDAIPCNNSKRPISSEAIAKEVRFQLESLNSLIINSLHNGFIGAGEAKKWHHELQHMVTITHLELFTSLGQQALQQQQAGQARLAFERGVQYLSKRPEKERYLNQFKLLKEQLDYTNALVLQQSSPEQSHHNQLAESLSDLDNDDPWKKKSVYD